MRASSIWIEAEVWDPATWRPANTNSNVIVTLEDGTRWVATFFSYANIASLAEKNGRTGENLHGKFFWASDMILVDEVSRQRIEEVVAHLLEQDKFKWVLTQLLEQQERADETGLAEHKGSG